MSARGEERGQCALLQLTRHTSNTYQFRVFNDGQPGVIFNDSFHSHVGVDDIELEKVWYPLVRFAMDRVHAHYGVRVERKRC